MRFVVIFSLIFTSNFSYAQAGTAALQKLLLDHQKSIPFKSHFTQVKTLKEMGVELNSEGELEVRAQGYATWKLLKPSFLSVELSPNEIKIYSDPKAAPRIIKKDQSKGDAMEASAWMELLMEKPQTLSQHFNVTQISPLKFKVTPLNSKRGFEAIEILFTPKAKLSEVVIFENSEDTLKIKFLPKGR